MTDRPTIRRWVIDRHGRDSLRVDVAPVPEPRRGEVRVCVAAVALNARDLMMIDGGMGLALAFPFVPASYRRAPSRRWARTSRGSGPATG